MSRILVTGATGFVGRHLCKLLASIGHEVVGTTRSNAIGTEVDGYELATIADLGDEIDWGPLLEGTDYVIHLAARVHVMRELEEDPLAAFRRVNVGGTERLLRHEHMRDVKRVIFISSVKVHGDETVKKPFSATDTPVPPDPYGVSKLEAENLVEEIGAEVGFETVIIRPPLVYGPGVGGNFARLLRLIDRGIPSPFGLVRNARSLVSVDNLCDLIRECLGNESAAGKRFLVSDNSDLSTPELVRHIAAALGRPSRLLPVPVVLMRIAANLFGRAAEVSRLTGSLQVDIDATLKTLDWTPPVSVKEGIASTVAWYQEQGHDA